MVDVVIVGSGATGGAAAFVLTQAGFDVTLIEKGGYLSREFFSKDEIAYCRRDLITPKIYDEYHVIEEKIDGKWVATLTHQSGISFFNGNIVGGSSNLMSGMFHRLHPYDFKLKSVFGEIKGANVVDWPISYEELEPYYALAEKLVGISGRFIPHPYEPPRSTPDFPYPPTKENAIVKYFDNTCKHLGFAPLVTPRAILSTSVKSREACYYSNFCGSYGCSSGAKGSSREAFIRPALATGRLTLRTNTHVLRLEAGKDKVGYAEVVDTVTGKREKLFAKLFIVAAQAHESVRLLFNSANEYHPNGLGNRHGNLGKHLIFSGGGSGGGYLTKSSLKGSGVTFEELMQPGLFVNRSLLDWYFIDDKDLGRVKGGLVEWMFEHQNIIKRSVPHIYGDDGLTWGEELYANLHRYFKEGKRLRFEIFNDWLPTDECFVTIDKSHKDRFGMPVGKLRIHAHAHDLKIGEFIAKKCEAILAHMKAEDIYSSMSASPSPNLVAGGCRFGNDPRSCVLDKHCRVHDLDNLYVIDASFMPTGGSVAPTWTIYANALRVSQYIAKSYNF